MKIWEFFVISDGEWECSSSSDSMRACSSPTLPEVPRVGEDYVLSGVERPRGDHPHEYDTSIDIITSLACCDLMMDLEPMMWLGL